MGRNPPKADAFFVNECLNFDVLEAKNYTIIKIMVSWKEGGRRKPLKYASVLIHYVGRNAATEISTETTLCPRKTVILDNVR